MSFRNLTQRNQQRLAPAILIYLVHRCGEVLVGECRIFAQHLHYRLVVWSR